MSRMVGGSEFYFQNINIATGKEWASLTAQQVKNLPAVQETQRRRFDPESERSPGGRNGNPLQYFCPDSPLDRGVWWITAQRVTRVRHD